MSLDPQRRGTDAPPDPRLRAFADVVEPEIEVLLRVGRSLTGSDTDAEDLVQETMIRAFGAIDRFDGRHPRAWLLTILRRTHLNMHRRQRPSTVGDWEVLHHARPAFGGAHAPSAEDRALAEDLDPALRTAMAALDARLEIRTCPFLLPEAASATSAPSATISRAVPDSNEPVRVVASSHLPS